MGLLVWVVLVVLGSSVTHLSAVDVNWLTEVVKEIRTEYRINSQFCLAANIPLTQNKDRLKEILEQNRYQGAVSDTVNEDEVYMGDNIIIAKHNKGNPVHAERQVLTNLQHLKPNRQGNFLLIYSYLSPCSKCTDWDNRYNILDLIYNNVGGWSDSAFVFTTVYSKIEKGPTISRDVLEGSISELGESMHGLSRVFRCYGQNKDLQCHSCSVNGVVSEVCVDNNAAPGQGGSRSRSPNQGPSRKRDGSQSPNQGPSRKRDGSQSPNQGPSRKRDRSRSPKQSSTMTNRYSV